MNNTMQVNDQVTVGPQPSDAEIKQIQQQGFKSVVNFRTDGEEEQPLSPSQEEGVVRGAGMDYLHLPVAMKAMKPELVDRFREEYKQMPKPVFAHCASGKRAGAMVMMHIACEQGWSGDETMQKAQEMGFECDKPELIDFVKQYVDSHSPQT